MSATIIYVRGRPVQVLHPPGAVVCWYLDQWERLCVYAWPRG